MGKDGWVDDAICPLIVHILGWKTRNPLKGKISVVGRDSPS